MWERVQPDTVATPAGAYSHAVRVPLADADLVFVAGQVPVDRDGRLVGAGDIAAQAEQVYANLAAVLRAAGAGPADVVKVTTFFAAGVDRGPARDARRRLFGDALPASTGVEVSALADPAWLLEVEAIAVVR